MRKPEFITFTGADDHTDVRDMLALSKLYPIEWGILFSISRQGTDPRYPGGEAMSSFLWAAERLKLSAHLCGEYTRAMMEDRVLPTPPADLGYFKRIQINHHAPDPARIIEWRKGWGRMRCIAQTRGLGQFPRDTSIDWLFDASGGRGVEAPEFPAHPGGDRLVGYAGGITPENVLAMIERTAPAGPYWIDMESGVRTDDRFDLNKCRAVCEAVYAPAPASAA